MEVIVGPVAVMDVSIVEFLKPVVAIVFVNLKSQKLEEILWLLTVSTEGVIVSIWVMVFVVVLVLRTTGSLVHEAVIVSVLKGGSIWESLLILSIVLVVVVFVLESLSLPDTSHTSGQIRLIHSPSSKWSMSKKDTSFCCESNKFTNRSAIYKKGVWVSLFMATITSRQDRGAAKLNCSTVAQSKTLFRASANQNLWELSLLRPILNISAFWLGTLTNYG